MQRFERLGLQLMNRASGDFQHDSIAAVLGDPTKRALAAQIIGQAYVNAYNLVLQNQEAIEHIANALVERKELYGDELVDLLNSVGLQEPVDRPDPGGRVADAVNEHAPLGRSTSRPYRSRTRGRSRTFRVTASASPTSFSPRSSASRSGSSSSSPHTAERTAARRGRPGSPRRTGSASSARSRSTSRISTRLETGASSPSSSPLRSRSRVRDSRSRCGRSPSRRACRARRRRMRRSTRRPRRGPTTSAAPPQGENARCPETRRPHATPCSAAKRSSSPCTPSSTSRGSTRS